MKRSRILHAAAWAGLALAMAATPAAARWQWVEEPDEYIEETTTYVTEEPRGPGYYQQGEPAPYYQRETYRREAPYVTDTEVFADGGCDVTRTYMSDGSWSDDRVCNRIRIVPPHVFIIDRIGRHFDRLRAHHHDLYYGY